MVRYQVVCYFIQSMPKITLAFLMYRLIMSLERELYSTLW